MGDPAGIGPEIVTKALHALAAAEPGCEAEFTAFGDSRVFAAAGLPRSIPIVEAGEFDPEHDVIAAPTKRSGAAAAAALLAAIDAAMRSKIDAIVTAPLSKEALKLAGHPWPGQTEVLIERSRTQRAVMLFVGGGLKVALATRHIALREVVRRLEPAALAADLSILDRSLRRDFGVRTPRIAVCGVNPHAGEHGLFGDEEATILNPVLERLRGEGLDLTGPLPADTLFVKLRRGEFDAAFAMYHDQGLIPVKLLAFGGGVNVSIGLPFLRTSPDHGTAYDIAGRGVADEGSQLEAVRLAIAILRRARPAPSDQ